MTLCIAVNGRKKVEPRTIGHQLSLQVENRMPGLYF